MKFGHYCVVRKLQSVFGILFGLFNMSSSFCITMSSTNYNFTRFNDVLYNFFRSIFYVVITKIWHNVFLVFIAFRTESVFYLAYNHHECSCCHQFDYRLRLPVSSICRVSFQNMLFRFSMFLLLLQTDSVVSRPLSPHRSSPSRFFQWRFHTGTQY